QEAIAGADLNSRRHVVGQVAIDFRDHAKGVALKEPDVRAIRVDLRIQPAHHGTIVASRDPDIVVVPAQSAFELQVANHLPELLDDIDAKLAAEEEIAAVEVVEHVGVASGEGAGDDSGGDLRRWRSADDVVIEVDVFFESNEFRAVDGIHF